MTLYFAFAAILALILLLLLMPLWRDEHVSRGTRQRFALLVAAFFIIGGYGMYLWIGTPEIIPALRERNERITALRQAILTDSVAIKINPGDLHAWVELGSSFIETSQYDAAANAFKQAVLLTGGKPQLIMAYARALILNDGGTVSDTAKKSLEMVLLQQPENPDARYFLALRELQDGHQQDAMKHMKELYHSLPGDSPLKATIDRQIGRTP